MTKEHKKARDQLERFARAIKSQHSFGKIKTFSDLLRVAGMSDKQIANTHFESERNKSLTYHDITEWLSDREIELTTKQWLELNPPQLNHVQEAQENQKIQPTDGAVETSQQNATKDLALVDRGSKSKPKSPTHYKLPKSQKQICKLKDFQEKEAAIILAHSIGVAPEQLVELWPTICTPEWILNPEKIDNARLLLSGVGTGKTFIYGAVLSRWLEMKYHKKLGSFSPWPYVVVTKASIVEQTKRVLETQFGINVGMGGDVVVINIDKLRSRFGELFVNEETVIESGEEHVIWKWRQGIYPAVVLWDECQTLKNYQSEQHKIAASYNDL